MGTKIICQRIPKLLEEKQTCEIIITGGGTGGHIYPALAFLKYLEKVEPDTEVLYIGTKKGLEAKIVPQAGIKLKTVDIQGLRRSLSPQNLKTAYKFFKSVSDAKKIMKEFKPDVVLGNWWICGRASCLCCCAIKNSNNYT